MFLISHSKTHKRPFCYFLPTATTQDISPPKANKTVTALSPHKTLKHKEQHVYRNGSPPSYTVARNVKEYANVDDTCLYILTEL